MELEEPVLPADPGVEPAPVVDEEAPFLEAWPDGLPDSLYAEDDNDVPRLFLVLPESNRAYRRWIAKAIRSFFRSNKRPVNDNDRETIFAYFEDAELRAWLYWIVTRTSTENVPGRFPLSLDLQLLRRAHPGPLPEFDEEQFAALCPMWPKMRKRIERVAKRELPKINPAALGPLMLWPGLRAELEEGTPFLNTRRGIEVLEAVFALSSITGHPWFVNEVCRLLPEAMDAFLELEDRDVWDAWEQDEEEKAKPEVLDAEVAAASEEKALEALVRKPAVALSQAVAAVLAPATAAVPSAEPRLPDLVPRPSPVTRTVPTLPDVLTADGAPVALPIVTAPSAAPPVEPAPEPAPVVEVPPAPPQQAAAEVAAPEAAPAAEPGAPETTAAAVEPAAPVTEPAPVEPPATDLAAAVAVPTPTEEALATPPAPRPELRRVVRPAAARPAGPEVRPVVQITCELAGTDADEAIRLARHELLAWFEEKGVRNMPAAAHDGAAFEIDATEGMPISVEAFDGVWAARFDTADGRINGRLWRTEVILGKLGTRPLVGVRLTAISLVPGVPLRPSVPRVVRRLVKTPGLIDYGARITEKAWFVDTEDDVDQLLALLENPRRTRPVHVVCEDAEGVPLVDPTELAQRMAGLSHVVHLSAQGASYLKRRLGPELGVWGPALRTYTPGFTQGCAPTNHPFATLKTLRERFDSERNFIGALEVQAIDASVLQTDLESRLPSFSRVRQWVQKRRLLTAREENLDDKQLLALYIESNQNLLNEIKEHEAHIESLQMRELEWADERDEIVNETRNLRARITFLEEALKARAVTEIINYPASYDETAEWAANHFADKLVLLARAERSLKKAVFDDLQLLCNCLKLLAGPYRDMRLGSLSRAEFDARCLELGVTLTKSGDASAARYPNEYYVQHRKQRRALDLHLKRGTSRDQAKCLRIYFFWDEEESRVMIGHLPGHLTTAYS
jgi:hypothetical protein